ncbi:hypothetical protein K440DRAFT_658311 [Wilcoxina mikolae CBS 423.85]|nr:hypothetical protein K440DRAFT_658311 [Wilcoxina mikolae CBS 423.85]
MRSGYLSLWSSVTRPKETPLSQFLFAYYLLALHGIASFGMVLLVVYFVDGLVVNYDGQSLGYRNGSLRASDVTTTISAAVVVVRLITTAWTTTVAWRCAFILLEIDGVTLLQFHRVVSWRILWPGWMGWTRNTLLVGVVLLFLAPSTFVAPVLTGAIGWREVSRPIGTEQVPYHWPDATTDSWFWYIYSPGDVRRASMFATGNAAFSRNIGPSECRHVMTYAGVMPVNSTLVGATLPCLDIHSITWDEKSQFLDNITTQLRAEHKWKSNMSLGGEAPFTTYHTGNAALFASDLLLGRPNYNATLDWNNMSAPLPRSTIYSGVKKIALLLRRAPTNGCSPVGGSMFGNSTSLNRLENIVYADSSFNHVKENCFLIGTVNLTAGVIRNQSATYIMPRVISAERQSNTQLQPDPWVEEALYLLPDVMPKVSGMNVSLLATWDNIDGYVADLIRLSYMATWDSLNRRFNYDPLFLTAHRNGPGLQAVVSIRRVIAWLLAQFLLTISGMVLLHLQKGCRRPVVIDPSAAALMTDSKQVLDEYDNCGELTRMSYATKDGCAGEKLRLIPDRDGNRFELKGGRRKDGLLAEKADGAVPLHSLFINLNILTAQSRCRLILPRYFVYQGEPFNGKQLCGGVSHTGMSGRERHDVDYKSGVKIGHHIEGIEIHNSGA